MSKPLLVFATLLEAKSTLQNIKAKQIKPNLYETCDFDLLITGMGVGNTDRALSSLSAYSNIINIGICGALKDFNFGDIFEITKVSKHNQVSFSINQTRPLSPASLVTYDFPVHDVNLRKLLSADYDLVDMEGWAVANACTTQKKPFQLIKIVSDFCSSTTSQEIQTRGSELSEIIKEYLLNA